MILACHNSLINIHYSLKYNFKILLGSFQMMKIIGMLLKCWLIIQTRLAFCVDLAD